MSSMQGDLRVACEALRDAVVGTDELDLRYTWLSAAAERLEYYAARDEDPDGMQEAASVLRVMKQKIREALHDYGRAISGA